ncbi:MAG: DNA mismatch repair endonuclease MutL [Calditrichia bacterium]
MSSITVLPPHIANKIAAGEVVDRPAAVVKELVENALDAGSAKITVVIEKAGKELIQVIDDGIGMTDEDVLLAFERHATSKIAEVEDLDKILTLGFRGEALPSIASVSRVEIKTRTENEPVGSRILMDGGKVHPTEKIPFNIGTSIAIRNLFFNTPARRNFLRADNTEFNHIHNWMKRFFLSFPQVHFVLIRDGEELYNLPAASLEDRIAGAMGKAFFNTLVPVRETLGDIQLSGFACRPDKTRGNSANQFMFLNNRAIVSRSMSHAIHQGYGNLIERGRYSQYVLFLEVPPDRVDINVHPKKLEVRFANDQAIYHLFLSAIREAIQSGGGVPSIDMKKDVSTDLRARLSDFSKESSFKSASITPPRPTNFAPVEPEKRPLPPEQAQTSIEYKPLPEDLKPKTSVQAPPESEGQTPKDEAVGTLWQVHKRYIFSQIKSGLVIIDQQVAHERILYEQVLKQLEDGRRPAAQQLLFPQTIDLPLEDFLIFKEIDEWLQKIGFAINQLSGRTIVIEAIPTDVRVGNEAKILLDIIDFYRENSGGRYEHNEKIAAAYANKNCIRSGETLTQEAMLSLINQLFATKEPYFCPHGRPVVVTLDTEELDRRFKR